MNTLRFLTPNERPQPSLHTLIERAWPRATASQIDQAFRHKRVRLLSRTSMNPARIPPPDALIEVEASPGDAGSGMPDAAELARGDGWVVVEKPIGMSGEVEPDNPLHPVHFLADTLGIDRAEFSPVWTHPDEAGGPWLCGLNPRTAARLRARWARGELMITWVVLVPSPERAHGRLRDALGIPIDYSATKMRDGVSELQLTAQPAQVDVDHHALLNLNPATLLLDALADAGLPVLGDAHRAGYMVHGGLRLRVAAFFDATSDLQHSWTCGSGWWPDCPVVTPEATSDDVDHAAPRTQTIGQLTVSAKTLQVLRKQGHPWVLADRDTGSRAHHHPGDLVQLRGVDGASGPWALIEGPGKLAARLWSHQLDDAADFLQEVDLRVDEAISRRSELLRSLSQTDLFRLIHGQADGLPGFYLDRVGPVLRATLSGATSFAFKERVYDNILDFDPGATILEVEHLRDLRRAELPEARLVRGEAGFLARDQRLIGHEAGLRFWLEPWEGVDVGFFPDQRDNRARIRSLAQPGSRWLNLFCHTGAFSVALIAEGAHVVSVDLSSRYLDWLDDNLSLNDLPLDHHTRVADDARIYLQGCHERFDGVIVDPPTAASSEAGFWSVRRDYQALLVSCLRLLEDQGVALICRNDKHPASALRDVVDAAAAQAGRRLRALKDAPASADYPSLRGFPEGDSFEGLLVFLE